MQKIPGVKAFLSAKDIPGKNAFASPDSGLLGYDEDEELFVGKDSRIQYNGQPCGIIVANRMDLANYAATKVKITYKKLKGEITMPLVYSNVPNRIGSLETGSEVDDVDEKKTIAGSFEIGEQFNFPMESQTTLCCPSEDGGLDVHSASQWMDLTQVSIAQCLGLPENKINMQVRRLGGAFGAKISRNLQTACACALASHSLQRPVRFVLTIESSLTTCGGRNACKSDYQVQMNASTGEIQNLNLELTQDFGCSPNEGNIIQMTALHNIFNGYGRSPNWKMSGKKIYSSTASTTWCRAPGTLEGIATIENIMEHVAFATKIDPVDVRLANIPNESPLKEMLENFIKDVGKSTVEFMQPVQSPKIERFKLSKRLSKPKT